MLMYLENIHEFVEDHNVIVTYKWLSRELNVPVNAAKQMLYAYVEKNPSVFVTYMVSGTVNTSGQKEYLVKLVKKEELDGIKEQFLEIFGVHVYSVQMVQLKDSGSLFAASYDVCKQNLLEYSRWSTIDCPNHSLNQSTAPRAENEPVSAPASSAATDHRQETTTSSASESPLLPPTKRPPTKRPLSNQPKAEDRKIPSKTKTKTKKPFFPQEKSVKDNALTKKNVSESRESVKETSDTDGTCSLLVKSPGVEIESSEGVSSVAEGTQKKPHDTLQFLNDSDIDGSESEEEEESKPAAQSQVKRGRKSKHSNGNSKDTKHEVQAGIKKRKRVKDLSSDEDTLPAERTDIEARNEESHKRKRKRTKKLVSKMHINDDGEMVTEKVWESDSSAGNEEESVTVDVSLSPAVESKPPLALDKPSPVKQEKKKQSSLFKFLKK